MADAAPPDWEKPANLLLGKVLYRAMWRKLTPCLPFFGELTDPPYSRTSRRSRTVMTVETSSATERSSPASSATTSASHTVKV